MVSFESNTFLIELSHPHFLLFEWNSSILVKSRLIKKVDRVTPERPILTRDMLI